jgi:hypothetical protein
MFIDFQEGLNLCDKYRLVQLKDLLQKAKESLTFQTTGSRRLEEVRQQQNYRYPEEAPGTVNTADCLLELWNRSLYLFWLYQEDFSSTESSIGTESGQSRKQATDISNPKPEVKSKQALVLQKYFRFSGSSSSKLQTRKKVLNKTIDDEGSAVSGSLWGLEGFSRYKGSPYYRAGGGLLLIAWGIIEEEAYKVEEACKEEDTDEVEENKQQLSIPISPIRTYRQLEYILDKRQDIARTQILIKELYVQFSVEGKIVSMCKADYWLNATQILVLAGKNKKQIK